MKSIFEASLKEILPESIDAEPFAQIAEALDPSLKILAAQAWLTLHLPRLDELNGKILDVLAEQFHCDNFNATTLDDEQKRNLIRRSIELHRLKGTRYAVEQVTKEFFSNPQVVEHGGFLFSVKTNAYTSTPDAFKTFIRMLFDAKNVRSHLKGIDIDLSPPEQKIFAGNVLSTDGLVDVGLKRPTGSLCKIHAGNLSITNGSLTINPRAPNGSTTLVKVGCPLVIGGHVLIDSATQPLLKPIRENPTADLALADIAIARGELLDAEDYDFLKLFFRYPTGIRRTVTLRNPREDVTKEEIQAVTEYAVEHNLLLDRDEEISVDAPKASLIKTVVRKII